MAKLTTHAPATEVAATDETSVEAVREDASPVHPPSVVESAVWGSRNTSLEGQDSVDLVLQLGEIVQTLTGTSAVMTSAIEGDLRQQHEALGEHLDRLGDEVKRLRIEMATARSGRLASQRDTDMNRHSIFRPIEPRATEELILSSPLDVLRRGLKHPWYYYPLVLGIAALAIILFAMLISFMVI